MAWYPKKSVVVAVDFSDSTVDALQVAADLVADRSHLHAVHVLLPLDDISPGFPWGAFNDVDRKQAAEKHLIEFLAKNDFAAAKSQVEMGDPGTVLADYASRQKADLLIIPSHGYQGMKRFLLGSTAETVIRYADCPVLVLRRRDAE